MGSWRLRMIRLELFKVHRESFHEGLLNIAHLSQQRVELWIALELPRGTNVLVRRHS